MAFNELPFNQRFKSMGDEAEAVYEEAKPMGLTTRFGWRRPKGITFKKMPLVLRHSPDYYAQAGYLVEVMGMGKDGVLKSLKVEKYNALKVWKRIADLLGLELALFIWNSYEQQYVTILWPSLVKLVTKSKRSLGVESFDDGNEYYPILWEWIIKEAVWVSDWSSE